MRSLLRAVALPRELTQFERQYLARVNRIALAFFALHVPVFALVAWANHTGPLQAALMTFGIWSGPALAVRALPNPRAVSIVHGVAAMCFGGLLVHLGQGPTQIEMHFYFFALLAMCSVFGNPMVILAAAGTVTLHHLVVWLVLPRSVFNYEAAWWVVGVHATFVVLESVAACFIAKSFFDNVIGLERIVAARTEALDARNRDMRLLLDHVEQGFLTIDRTGALAAERSAAVDRWLGAPEVGATWFDHLDRQSPSFGEASRLGWEEVSDGIMPIEVTVSQMPSALAVGGRRLRVVYQPIGAGDPPERFLVIVTDVTTELEHQRTETERREVMVLFEHLLAERSVLETFLDDAASIVELLRHPGRAGLVEIKRALHTLKGNASLFGLASIADLCHALEDVAASEGRAPTERECEPLFERWGRLVTDAHTLLGGRRRVLEVEREDLAGLLAAVRVGETRDALVRRVKRLQLEPVHKRLAHFAEQAKRIAARLGRGDIAVEVDDGGVRLDPRRWAPLWGAFIHAIRNAVDHGLESLEERHAAGKPGAGRLVLRSREELTRLVFEVIDDGRGVDWAAVAEKASRSGLPSGSPEDLRRALFADGVSTASSVTEVSGRGVGMGALLEGARALGGRILVDTERGAGTTLRLTFPLGSTSSPSGEAVIPAA